MESLGLSFNDATPRNPLQDINLDGSSIDKKEKYDKCFFGKTDVRKATRYIASLYGVISAFGLSGCLMKHNQYLQQPNKTLHFNICDSIINDYNDVLLSEHSPQVKIPLDGAKTCYENKFENELFVVWICFYFELFTIIVIASSSCLLGIATHYHKILFVYQWLAVNTIYSVYFATYLICVILVKLDGSQYDPLTRADVMLGLLMIIVDGLWMVVVVRFRQNELKILKVYHYRAARLVRFALDSTTYVPMPEPPVVLNEKYLDEDMVEVQ